jgi:hypothetical protein
MDSSLIIIDNFYDDPDSVRDLALSCEYFPEKTSDAYPNGDAPWPGKMSKESHAPSWVDGVVSKRLHKNMRQTHDMLNGVFRIAKESQVKGILDNVVHTDGWEDNYYAGVLYLSKDREDIPGTMFYTQKSTGLDRIKDADHNKEIFRSNEDRDISKWHMNEGSNVVYNRLIIYPAYKFHGIGPAFGTTDDTARIVQLFTWIDIK